MNTQKYPLIPYPQKITSLGEVRVIIGEIVTEEEQFETAKAVFEQYRKKLCAPEVKGSTVSLCLDTSMADGAYRLVIDKEGIVASAADITGIHYAMATLLQLSERTEAGLSVSMLTIEDAPDCQWRGFMIDLARQWHDVDFLYRYIDLCWLYKIKFLQLHFTDDQSYTLPSKRFPKLPTEGRHYTAEEIAEVRHYALARGVVLVPEIDAPGHAKPFNAAYPEIFGSHDGLLCAEDKTFEALDALYEELCELFPEAPYIHLGGDEAKLEKWKDCPGCMSWREENHLADEKDVYCEYIRRITEMILKRDRIPVIWEGFPKEGNARIDKRVLVFSWENYYQPAPDLLEGGFTVINASWKPLYIVAPDIHWPQEEVLHWQVNEWQHWWDKSAAFNNITVDEGSKLLGGQLCAWGDNLAKLPIEQAREGAEGEFALVRERLPALAEKTWNRYSQEKPEELRVAYEKTDALLTELMATYY